MKLVGLTGGIASGKTTIAEMFKEKGCRIINTDKIYWDLLAPTTSGPSELALKIQTATGINNFINCYGIITCETMRNFVFTCDANRKLIEKLTKQAVENALKAEIEKAKTERIAFCIAEIPLLFEAGWDSWFKEIIVVHVDEETQISRLMNRANINRDEAIKRIKIQMPVEDKLKKATWTINNIYKQNSQVIVDNLFEVIKNSK